MSNTDSGSMSAGEKRNREIDADIILCNRMEAPLVEDINSFGYRVNSVFDLVDEGKLSESLIAHLNNQLSASHHSRTIYSILSVLRTCGRKFDGRALAAFIDRAQDPGNVAEAIQTVCVSAPTNIEDWLRTAFDADRLGDDGCYLSEAIAKILPQDEAIALLLPRLRIEPFSVADGLAICGDATVLAEMDRQVGSYKGEEKKAIEKAIKKLRKRFRAH